MRRTLSRTRSQAPFLFGERGSLSLTRALANAGGRGAAFGEGEAHVGLTLRGEHEATGAVSDSDGDGAFLALAGTTAWTRCTLRGATLTGSAPGSSWEVVDLTAAEIRIDAPGASFAIASFRDADLGGGSFAGSTFVLCDFSGARLRGVDLSGCRFVGCDFTDAWLEDVNTAGTDLRGAIFRGAGLDGPLSGADVAGADFRGATGLDEGGVGALRNRGARAGGGGLARVWSKLLIKEPSADAHRRVRRAVSATWGALAIALPVLFFARAAMHPAEPDFGPEQAVESEADKDPSEKPAEDPSEE